MMNDLLYYRDFFDLIELHENIPDNVNANEWKKLNKKA